MEYTLDSVTHAMQCLKEKLKIKKIKHIPMLGSLEEIWSKKDNVYYFGVVTVGHNIENMKLMLLGVNFIEIQTDTQIISLFDHMTFDKLESNTIAQGQFRGFMLLCEPSSYVSL